jgi:hypothetical protein
MLKRKNRGIVFMVLVVFAMLFAGIEAMADNPMSCNFVTGNGGSTTITASAIPDSSGNFPITATDPTTGAPVYVWAYHVTGASPNQLNALEAVCPKDNGYKILSGGQVLAPGSGDPTTGFGAGDFQDWVVRMAAQQGSGAYGLPAGSYSFTTTRNGDTKNTSMAIKLSNQTYYCPNIAGPSCFQAEVGAETDKTICVNPDLHPGACWKVKLGPSGKLLQVLDEGGVPLTILDLATQTDVKGPNGLPLRFMKDGVAEWGDTSCYTYVSAGRLCQKCY